MCVEYDDKLDEESTRIEIECLLLKALLNEEMKMFFDRVNKKC